MYEEKTIIASSIDQLVKKGVEYIKKSGHRINTHSGGALQSNNVTYVLTDCRNRVHTLRSEKAIPYFAFVENIDTRRALININGIQHKVETKDFPCTVGILYRIENNTLNCDVQSRSTDIVTGLPYDMGFFSVVTELLASLLTEDLKVEIKPGYVAMHASFTQIYDKTAKIADEIECSKEIVDLQKMPEIKNGQDVLDDIYSLGEKLPKTKFIEWSIRNAK